MKTINLTKITMGTCYYPEHWEKSLWADDLRRMKENGIEVIRIAEFAWSKFEPREGEFTFAFFDEFMDMVQKTDMKVIFGTPTATPPAWLTEKYPEVLNADIDGNLYRHGTRRHYNYNSPKYHELSSRIVDKMAEHYGKHPNIIGWQIDNEFNCAMDVFYSESDTKAFRAFLKEKYHTLDVLNAAWGTVFWNQTYTEWEEIYVPRKTIGSANPHVVLDYTRFVSDSACKFANMQSKIIRKYIKPTDFVTTNGMFGNLDNHRMTEESLDFYTYDSYPNFAYALDQDPKNATDLNDRKWSKSLTEVRSISPTFGIMEQQSGANGWNFGNGFPAPKPGQMTLWTMQSIAHGADFISYFRWRTCTFGSEIYWHGILDYSNRDNRRLQEVSEIRDKFKRIGEVAGATYKACVGVIKDYDNIWDAQLDRWHEEVEKTSQKGIFEAAQLTHTPLDYLYLRPDTTVKELQKYEVLFYPHATILTKEHVDLLAAYAAEGGTLIFGCRTGYKDITGKCVMEKLPGLVQELSGTDVTEYTFVGPNDEEVFVEWDGTKVEAAVFHDILEPLGETAQVIGRYDGDYYKGQAGLIKNIWGKGTVYYFGGVFSRSTAEVFLEKLGVTAPYEAYISLPKKCELAVREKDGRQYLFVLNYAHEQMEVQLKRSMLNLYTEKMEKGSVVLEPYETKVYRM